MSLDLAIALLSWPSRDQILNPSGDGANFYARLARDKVGKAIQNMQGGTEVNVGVLSANPQANSSETPIAIVCEFANKVSDTILEETHRLAWNFSRTQLLITVEPHQVRAWTCCEIPKRGPRSLHKAEIREAKVLLEGTLFPSPQSSEQLHWVQLISGQFFKTHQRRFRRDRCADQMLLNNLDYVRRSLHGLGLSYDYSHDLLARIIFIQFLFHRKDSSGVPALNKSFLRGLWEDGILSSEYESLEEILLNYYDSYELFRLLNVKFNGDLFPGQGATPEEREAEWQEEMKQVKPRHLRLLADFISGTLLMEKNQPSLWPMYSFDAIPLEFISSIYEAFVSSEKKEDKKEEKKREEKTTKTNKGAHYTPGHIVDFVLDGVLPWNSKAWNLRILDPACGSGIFLVKAFQRLIYRWRNAHPNEEPKADTLKKILENNLFGIDVDKHAVRVASFSLYLAMCDEIDPKYYWQQVRFPRLRGRQLIAEDFFDSDKPLFIKLNRRRVYSRNYDLVVGNAPWGRKTMTELATSWGKDQNWPVTRNDMSTYFGTLFIARAASLTKPDGKVTMVQPAGALLFNRNATAKSFREKLFTDYKVEHVVNLSTLRFKLFRRAVGPACIITLRPKPANNQPITYICPKPHSSNEDDFRIFIEPHDINIISVEEAVDDPLVWTTLMWGGRRDLAVIKKLNQNLSLGELESVGGAKSSEGIIYGEDVELEKDLLDRKILESEDFPERTFLHLNLRRLPQNEHEHVHRSMRKNIKAFDLPQLLIKQSWNKKNGRFRAAISKGENGKGAICSQSYISVHAPKTHYDHLEAACFSYNSKVAVYYLLLTSGRLASYRPEPLVEELLSVPYPRPRLDLLENLNNFNDIDARAKQLFQLKEAEWVLVEDLFNFTLQDFKGGPLSPGRLRTRRSEDESDLRVYCEYFLKVLKAGFGNDKPVCASIFQEVKSALPLRIVAIYFNSPSETATQIEQFDSSNLLEKLDALDEKFLVTHDPKDGGIFFRRVARVYSTTQRASEAVPTVYLVKPDQKRYWTRSVAMQDADDVAADILLWQRSIDAQPSHWAGDYLTNVTKKNIR